MSNAILNAMQEHLGASSDVVRTIGRTFELMGVAEEEIDAAKRRWPRRKHWVDAAFGILTPLDGIVNYPDAVYRHHVRQLLERVALAQDTRPATDVEMLLGLSQASLRAPLTRDYVKLMQVLFYRVFPERAAADRVDGVLNLGGEDYPGSVAEKEVEMRRKGTRRVVPKEKVEALAAKRKANGR